jgi:hypothetical protein
MVSRHTCSAWRSLRRRESDGSGLTPSELFSLCAKWVKPYLSPSGFGAACTHIVNAGNDVCLCTHHGHNVATQCTVVQAPGMSFC